MRQEDNFDVTIAGEVNLDLILYGLPRELQLERELLAQDFCLTLGSSSAILAHNLAALGMRVGFITKAGADPLGQIAIRRLEGAGVDVSRSLSAPPGVLTGVTILLPHGNARHILTYPGAMATMSGGEVDLDYLARGRHFHVSSLFLQEALRPDLPRLFRTLKNRGLSLSLDTNDDPEDRWGSPLEELLSIVDVFLPNEDEAKRIAGTDDPDAALTWLAEKGPLIAMKCGGRGSMVAKGDQRWKAAPLSVVPIDTIGAGDSFNAGFLKGYLDGLSPQQCAEMGNLTAALSTLRQGGTESFRDKTLMREFLKRSVAVS